MLASLPPAASPPPRLGYCCINLSMGEKFRTMTLSWARSRPDEWLKRWKEVVSHNFSLLTRIIEWNAEAGIRLFRISSDLVPFADHPEYGLPWRRARRFRTGWWHRSILPASTALTGAMSRGSRFTMHPPQFVSLGSPNPKVRRSSVSNLEYHAALMDDLGLPRSLESPINIHVGNGTRPGPTAPLVRASLNRLSQSVRSRLVFENEQSGYWTPSSLMRAFPEVPVTLDYHHLLLNPDPVMTVESIEEHLIAQWGSFRPVCHWSEGRTQRLDPAHSEYVGPPPPCPFDIEVEAKGKDLAVLRLMQAVADHSLAT